MRCESLRDVDLSILHTLNNFVARHDTVEDPVLFYANAAEALFLAMLLLVAVVARGQRWLGLRRAAVAAGLSAGLALAIGQLVSHLVERARPFVTHPASVHLFARHVADASFPSDHATASVAIAVAILLRKRPWGSVVTLFALILCVGRVAIGVHYPSDVLGGALLGTVAALVLWAPGLRVRVDGLSDFAGGAWDGLLARIAGRIGLATRG
jgi:undecaprenyl-diphosphatase